MKYKKTLLIICIIACVLFSVSAVTAGDVNETVMSNGDEEQIILETTDDEILETDDGTFTALQNKINNAVKDSTISLENNYVYDDGFDTGGIIVEKTLTIDGRGYTIDGKGSSKIFLFKASNIVVKNLRFINGNGGISRYGPIENCTAINCIFENCHSGNPGGALNSISALNCTFIGNQASDGGAIFGGSAINCKFINNSASSEGGALYVYNDNMTVKNCSFIGNLAKNGGALCISEFIETSIHVSDCSFENNTARSGGAISWSNPNGILRDSTFKSNTASDGGAIYWKGANGMIINCDFMANSADKSYGAVYGRSVDVVSCNFTANRAKNIGAASISGTITNCNFIGNSALEKCGALYLNFNAYNCTFINNTAAECGAIEITQNIAASSPDSYINRTMSTGMVFANNTPNDFGGGYSVIGNSIFVYPQSEYGFPLTGTITVLIAGKTFKRSLYEFLDTQQFNYDAIPRVDITGIATGDYEATVLYSGGVDTRVIAGHKNYGPSEMHFMMHIESKIEISSLDVVKYCGGDEMFTVTVTDDNVAVANAEVRMTVNGKVMTAKTNSEGVASFPLDLPVGTYDVVSEYDGVSATSKITVKSTITASDAAGNYSTSKVSASFLDTAGRPLASKQVTFKVGTRTYAATTNANGVATANIPLDVGTYTVTAVNPVNNEEKQFKLTISKGKGSFEVTSAQNAKGVTLTADFTPASVTGSVVFLVDFDKSYNAGIVLGKASVNVFDLAVGKHDLTVMYEGDSNWIGLVYMTSFNVEESYPILSAKSLTKTYGTSSKLTVNLIDSKGNPLPTEVVDVTINGITTPVITNANGQATIAINLAPGTYTAAIAYQDLMTVSKVVVKKAAVKLTAKAKTFKKSAKTKKYTMTLKNNLNKAMKNTKVTLKVKGKTFSVKTNSKGQATVNLKFLTKKGKYTATVKYAGSKYYNSKTVKAKITVK